MMKYNRQKFQFVEKKSLMNLRQENEIVFFSIPSNRNILYLIIYTKSNLFLIKPIEKFQIMPLKKYYGLLL